MANLKFSQFQEQTDPANVQFVVGYNGTDNVRIDPANLGGGATDLNGLSDCSTADGSSVYVGNVPPGLSGSSLSNTVLGDAAGNSIVSGFRNTLVGRNAGDSISFGDYHVCIGNGAGGSLTTANETVCIGNDAGGNSTASDTVIIGASSGRNAISTGHISIGYGAGFSQTSGTENTFLGFSSAYSVTTGSHNTVVGYEAGYSSLSGDSNTLIGASAGYSGSSNLITGSNNIIIGHDASPSGFAADNEITLGNATNDLLRIPGLGSTDGHVLTYSAASGGIVLAAGGGGGGASSLNDLTDVLIDGTSSYFIDIPASLSGNPVDNVVIGDGAGSAIQTGTRNTLLGHDAGDGITSGGYNTCIGMESGGNFSGNFNTTLGCRAGYLSSGSKNNSVAVGYQASTYLPSFTTAIGYRCGQNAIAVYGTYLGYETMRDNQASFNVGIGYRAGRNNAGGSNNVFVGKEAGLDNFNGGQKTCIGELAGSTSTGSNVTLIGYNSQPSAAAAANEITLGDSNVSTLRCAVTTITSLSDERDKSDIKDLEYGLDFINSLKPREFVWDNRAEIKKQDVLDENGEPSLDDDGNIVTKDVEFYSANKGKKDFGFIAQEVKELDNDTLRLVYSENVEKLEMSYGKLVPILVKAIQELKAEIELLK